MKDENKILKFIYAVFLGGLLTAFVGFGIYTFYQPPTYPEYPSDYSYHPANSRQEKIKSDHDDAVSDYERAEKNYPRNVSIIALILAVGLLALSLFLEKKVRVITDGIMLGGLFLLVFSLIFGANADSSKYTFIAATISVVAVLILGYLRFAKPGNKSLI